MKFTSAIFDLDGTLLDTLEDLADSVNKLLIENKFPSHPIDSYRYFVGDGIRNLLIRALPKNENPDNEKIQSLLNDLDSIYQNHWMDKTHPYDGISSVLHLLNIKGVSLSVLSNKPDIFTQKMVRHFFPEITFDIIFGARNGIPRKPDPFAVHEIITITGMVPAHCVFVGDSNVDIQTGKNARLTTIGAGWGFRGKDELRKAEADFIIENPNDLLRFF